MPRTKRSQPTGGAKKDDEPGPSRTTKQSNETAAAARPKRGAVTVEDEPPAKKSKLSADASKTQKRAATKESAKAKTTTATTTVSRAAPKPRGRSTKSSNATTEPAEEPTSDLPMEDAPTKPVEEDSSTKKGKKRGRAATTTIEEPEKTDVGTKRSRGQGATKDKKATTAVDESAPKRGRGRTAKAIEPAEDVVDDPEPAAKKPRGRRANSPKLEVAPKPAPKGRGRAAKTDQADTPAAGKPARKGAAARTATSSAVETSGQTKPSTANTEEERPMYWLMKAEPEPRFENGHDVSFSIDTLASKTEPEPWDGVRNAVGNSHKEHEDYEERELAFFYHSNCKVPGIAGLMEIVEEAQVDSSAFDTQHYKYDQKSNPDKPRWYCVKVAFRQKYSKFIPLKELQTYGKDNGVLAGMQLLKQSRLSVSRVSKKEWEFIMTLLANDEEAPAPSTEDAKKGQSKSKPKVPEKAEKVAGTKEGKAPEKKARGGRKAKPPAEAIVTASPEVPADESKLVDAQQDSSCQVDEQNEATDVKPEPEPRVQTLEVPSTDQTQHTILSTIEGDSALSAHQNSALDGTEQPLASSSAKRTASCQSSIARSTRAASRQRSVPPTSVEDAHGLGPPSAGRPGSRGKSAQPPARPVSQGETRARSAQPELSSRPATANTLASDGRGLTGVAEMNEVENDSTFDGIGESFNF